MNPSLANLIDSIAKCPAVLEDIYGNLLKPGVKQAGQALETVIGLGNTVLWPIAMINAKSSILLKRNMEMYRQRMEKAPMDDITHISPEIGVPILEKLSYISDEKLANLYTSLLATASRKSQVENAHPSFVNIINNLCPDEALILEKLNSIDAIAYCRAKAVDTDGSFSLISEVLISEINDLSLTFPQNIDLYLKNLKSLGLIEMSEDFTIKDEEQYNQIIKRESPALQKTIESAHKDKKLEFFKGVIDKTSLAKKFLAACIAQ